MRSLPRSGTVAPHDVGRGAAAGNSPGPPSVAAKATANTAAQKTSAATSPVCIRRRHGRGGPYASPSEPAPAGLQAHPLSMMLMFCIGRWLGWERAGERVRSSTREDVLETKPQQ